jgi:hypothetical protein
MQKAPIFLTTGVKGGVGKSLVSIFLADLFQRRERKVIVIDGDIETPDVFRCFEHETEAGVQALPVNLDSGKGWGEVVSLADENPEAVVIINAAAASGEAMVKHGVTLRDYAREAGRSFLTIWMMNTQPMCCVLLHEMIRRLPDISVHVGLNTFYAESTGDDFTDYRESKLKGLIRDKGGVAFEFPVLSGHLTRPLQKDGGQSLRRIYQSARKGDQMLIDGWRRAAERALGVVVA